MEVLGAFALLYLGNLLLTEAASGLAGARGRRLLARARGVTLGLAGVLLGLATGSGTGLTLLGRGLLQAGLLGAYEAGLLALGGTLGATAVVGLASLGNRALALLSLSLALGVELALRKSPWGRLLFGLGLLFLGLDLARTGALAWEPLLTSLPPALLFALGFLLAFALGSANLVALLALGLGHEGTAALVLGGGVGCTGPLLLRAPPEALRLGGALLLHRLALALPLLFLDVQDVLALHVGYHALALLAFPLLFPPLHRLMVRLLPPEPPLAPKYLRPEALEDPPLAQALALRELARIGDAARAMLARTLEALRKEEGREADLSPLEEKVDWLSREVLLYVARLPEEASLPYLKAAAELEHLADLAKRILRKAERLWGQGITFSPEGHRELARLLALTLARLERALAALATADPHLARRVQTEGFQEALEASRQAHRKRLQEREESRASTLTHLDLLLLLEELNQGISRLARLVEELRPQGPEERRW
ncbi:sodium:phosphate symporter [Thermus composti]|uniref:Na/Pi cotransporter family protein n=1 Tax=Thermus composti TaxID=532059 RepID=A0ABV6Q152_9DEIN|nr:Na/Pi cotransporter family protein [Thermus composti]GGN04845.1 sodium:phosphate symporter [Thermus composti]